MNLQDIQPDDLDGHAVVVHLTTQAGTPLSFDSPSYTVTQNIEGTVTLLEAMLYARGCLN